MRYYHLYLTNGELMAGIIHVRCVSEGGKPQLLS